jgi:hypothetical protein
MSLKSIQEGFIQQLTGSQPADEFLASLAPCGNLFPKQQLAIYQNNVRGALQTSLAQVYPVCRKILGENYFKQLASVYIKKYPSRQHDLNDYGEYFSDFIYLQYQQRSELNDFSYLSDLVQLEWFYHHVYYAAQGSMFDFSAFSQLTQQQQAQSIFQIVPCLKFISSSYPILSIWQLNQDDSTTQQTLVSNAENCYIFRKNNQIRLIAIDAKMYKLLSLVNEGATLKEITQTDEDNNFPELIRHGLIASFKVKHHV